MQSLSRGSKGQTSVRLMRIVKVFFSLRDGYLLMLVLSLLMVILKDLNEKAVLFSKHVSL